MNEMKRRRDFYRERGKDVDRLWSDHNRLEYYTDDDGEVQRARVIFAEDEQISLALQLSPDGKPPRIPAKATGRPGGGAEEESGDCRYLLCPAVLTIGHLKKFIRLKFSLADRFQIDVYHSDEALRDRYTLIDVAYIYMWRRKGPLCLYYTVYTNPPKKTKSDVSCTETQDLEKSADDEEAEKSEEKEDVKSDEDHRQSDDKSAMCETDIQLQGLSAVHGSATGDLGLPPSGDSGEEKADKITKVSSKEIKESPSESSKPTTDASVVKENEKNDSSLVPSRDLKEHVINSLEKEKQNLSVENSNGKESCVVTDIDSNKTKETSLETNKPSPAVTLISVSSTSVTSTSVTSMISGFSSTGGISKSSPKKEKHSSNRVEKQPTSGTSKSSSAILVVPTSDNSSETTRIPKLKLNTSKYTSQGIVTKSATLTTPIYHPRSVQKRPASPKIPLKGEKPSPEKMAKKICTQENHSKPVDKTVDKKPESAKSSSPKKTSSEKPSTCSAVKTSTTAKTKLSLNGSAKPLPSNYNNVKTAKNDPVKASQNNGANLSASSAVSAVSGVHKKASKPTSNGQRLKLTVPYSSYNCYSNGLTIPSPIGLSPTVTSARTFPSALNRTLSSSPTRRKTSSPSRRVPASTPNGRLTPGSSVSPSSLYSLSPSPTNRSFPTSPSPHSYNPAAAARLLQSSPLARQMYSPTGGIFSFPDRGPPMTQLPITVPTAHTHLNLRLNTTSSLYSSDPSPHNGDLPQDLSLKKKTTPSPSSSTSPSSSSDPTEPPTKTLKIPIKVPIQTNGLSHGEVDKFAFTDDEEDTSPVGGRKLHPIKAEPGAGP
uniref:Polycomb group protein Psc-like isoform X2 n=1 Tax=Crassostrea virginica TaxID=6565 RepID=A0A8B8BUR8_CRAVI|nr:polycomb group protein Psc-like isoform X2 [Crassostrea virginica]